MKSTAMKSLSLQQLLRKFISITVFALLPLSGLVSCSDDDNNCIETSLETEEVTTVNAPETAQVNQTVEIEVQFQVDNSCGDFSRFIEDGSGTEKIIQVEAVYEGCACAQVIETRTATYQFQPNEPGSYELNFRSGPDEFITVTIEVEND